MDQGDRMRAAWPPVQDGAPAEVREAGIGFCSTPPHPTKGASGRSQPADVRTSTPRGSLSDLHKQDLCENKDLWGFN